MKKPRVKDSLKNIGVTPSKQRGQNFIINSEVLDQIVDFGKPANGDSIVEIGPGLGALTERLVPYNSKLAVVEIEEQFCKELSARYPEMRLWNGDVRRCDFSQFGSDLIVFGNLPYSFSTDIIFHLLEQRMSITRAVLMLQREFAERVAAPPGSRTYGALSVNVQVRSHVRLGPVISGDSFHPKANVESILIELDFAKELPYQVADLTWFRKVVNAAFLQRRKKIKNSLMASGIFQGEEAVTQLLEKTEIDPGIRAEMLDINGFVRLAEFGVEYARRQ